MRHNERIINGVLCWQDGAYPETWHPYTPEQLSSRVAVVDIALTKKNERIAHLAQHIDALQTILIDSTGQQQAALYGAWYMQALKKNNIDT